MSAMRYAKLKLNGGEALLLQISSESDEWLTGLAVNKEGEHIECKVLEGVLVWVTRMIQKSAIVQRTEMRMNLHYAELEAI